MVPVLSIKDIFEYRCSGLKLMVCNLNSFFANLINRLKTTWHLSRLQGHEYWVTPNGKHTETTGIAEVALSLLMKTEKRPKWLQQSEGVKYQQTRSEIQWGNHIAYHLVDHYKDSNFILRGMGIHWMALWGQLMEYDLVSSEGVWFLCKQTTTLGKGGNLETNHEGDYWNDPVEQTIVLWTRGITLGRMRSSVALSLFWRDSW